MTRRLAARLGLALLVCHPCGASGQSAQGLADQCITNGGDATSCVLAAGAGRDVAGYIATLAGPGAEAPGQSSTLGMRLGGTPRFAVSLRASGLSAVLPDLAGGGGTLSPLIPAIEGTVAVGVFEGINVLPTVGGLFSVDLVGSVDLQFFPPEEGFAGSVNVLSIGARVGILRESFTLPAVTIAASRRLSSGLHLSSISSPLPRVEVDPAITSLRFTVGKDLFGFGVMAGAGWDDLSSSTTVRVASGTGFASIDDRLEESRGTYFAGLSKQLGVISWIAGEVGWVNGFDPVTAGSTASPEVGRTIYGSVSLLLRL